MSNEYENCKLFKEVTLAKQRERDGYTVEGKDARYWHAEYLAMKDAYLNMRDFANANELDTATTGGSNAGTQRPGTPDGSFATETRKPGSLK